MHDRILQDRELDEFHPLLPYTHYGAHKAAIEAFVRSYGYGQGYPICALRPTGIYGLANPPEESKWFDLVRRVARGEAVTVSGGGKEVHVADVARAVELMLSTEEKNVTGEVYNCYDRYISEYDVAVTARELAGSTADIAGEQKQPLNRCRIESGIRISSGAGRCSNRRSDRWSTWFEAVTRLKILRGSHLKGACNLAAGAYNRDT